MKVLIARFNHETNTFSPVPTPLQAFGAGNPRGPSFGVEAANEARASRYAMSAMLAAAEARGCEIVTPVNASANPSGPVAAAAYTALCDAICHAVSTRNPAAILLDLHGAMVAQNSDDGEGDLLARIRKLAPRTPLSVALDLHANVSPKIVKNADIIVGFKTYPHIDMFETGAHAARLLFDMLDGKIKPVMAYVQPPLMAHTLAMDTNHGVMKAALKGAIAREKDAGILACSVFGGFPLADTKHAGMSIVVVADGDAALAQSTAQWGADFLVSRREEFVYTQAPLADSIARAKRARKFPVILLDHGDNCMSGGTCDTVDAPRAALVAGLQAVLVGPTCDPQAVRACQRAGVGAVVTLQVGGKQPMPRAGVPKPGSLTITGTVRAITDGSYRVVGPIYTGSTLHMGTSSLVTFGEHEEHAIVLTSQTQEPLDLGCFTSLGVSLNDYRFWVLKSRMYFKPVFAPLAAAVIPCASAGATSSDYSQFRFKRVRRPVFPLDL